MIQSYSYSVRVWFLLFHGNLLVANSAWRPSIIVPVFQTRPPGGGGEVSFPLVMFYLVLFTLLQSLFAINKPVFFCSRVAR